MVRGEIEKLIGVYGRACYEHGNMAAQYENEGDVVDSARIAKAAHESLVAVICQLEKSADTLRKLEAAGVDNWEGYSEAFQEDDELDDEEEETANR